MVDVSAADIDDNLGVRKLVKPSRLSDSQDEPAATGAPATATRQRPDQWSSNNGSVIYSQSEVVKSHLLAQGSRSKNSGAGESQHGGAGLSATQAQHHSLSKYIKANGLSAAETAPSGNPNYQTLRPAKYGKRRQLAGAALNRADSTTTTSDNSDSTASGDAQAATNWSNETTSDLLF